MTEVPPLNGRIIVQAERAARAVLDAHLAKTDTAFMTWVPLNLIATEPETTIDALSNQMATNLQIAPSSARQAIEDLVHAGLVTVSDSVRLTEDGRATHQRINVGLTELTTRLYDGLPHDDLLVARRVLETLTSRARAELANAS
jgi:DNA-binding MarR family transcriptional regulator